MSHVILKILRGIKDHQYWEEFELPITPNMNIISALMEIQKNPINRKGEKTTPVAWEQGCLEEVCGSCSMLINGNPRQSCSALIEVIIRETKHSTITLAPFTKFPLLKDLIVDRTQMFESLKKVKGWVSVDGTWDTHEGGVKIPPEVEDALYVLSTCMVCGCCSEACPQVNDNSSFMGPAIISQVRRFNSHPIGALQKSERLREVLQEDGIAGCGNAQNCVRVCPKKIPLTESLSLIGREATKQSLKNFFSLPDAKEE